VEAGGNSLISSVPNQIMADREQRFIRQVLSELMLPLHVMGRRLGL